MCLKYPLLCCHYAVVLVLWVVMSPPLSRAAQEVPVGVPIFSSRWSKMPDRQWTGSDFWANRLQDWGVVEGRLECVDGGRPFRTLHLLTHQIGGNKGGFEVRVVMGVAGTAWRSDAMAGFLIGAGEGKLDYRAASLIHEWPGKAAGVLAVVDIFGTPSLFDFTREVDEPPLPGFGEEPPKAVALKLTGEPAADGKNMILVLESRSVPGDVVLGDARWKVPTSRLVGNIALVSHGGWGEECSRFWFKDWKLSGGRVDSDQGRKLGPIISAQHTLSGDKLTLNAQLMPVGDEDPEKGELQVMGEGGGWETVAHASVVKPGYTLTFRPGGPFQTGGWDGSRDHRYRIVYGREAYTGTIKKDPVGKDTVVVAAMTGNHNNAHGLGKTGTDWGSMLWFPHADLTGRVVEQEPDMLFFAGDQVYESRSPTPAVRDAEGIKDDYLYKWYLWCWAYRDLTRDIASVILTDDHDIYQPNLWGEGGRHAVRDHDGGYVYPVDFIRMVERTQTGHLPVPVDPAPVGRGIGVYFTEMVYGGISFALLEDRKFKSGCARHGLPPSGGDRPDHYDDPEFDVATLDKPGLKLLGDRQLGWLGRWVRDWSSGAEMKVALSQTGFANMATHHGPGLKPLRVDLDSNGWPQSGRARALDILRRGFAFHLAGDQQVSTVVHHGIEAHGDAGWSFCVPPVANFSPRQWKPETGGGNREEEVPAWSGEHLDGLGNRVTVYAATDPSVKSGHDPATLHDQAPGYGIVRFDKLAREITVESWPRYVDPEAEDAEPYPGWPVTIFQEDNYGRKAAAWLPTLVFEGIRNPVVEVIEERTGAVVYTLRIRGTEFQPKVFEAGAYTVRAGELGGKHDWMVRELKGLRADSLPSIEPIVIKFGIR